MHVLVLYEGLVWYHRCRRQREIWPSIKAWEWKNSPGTLFYLNFFGCVQTLWKPLPIRMSVPSPHKNHVSVLYINIVDQYSLSVSWLHGAGWVICDAKLLHLNLEALIISTPHLRNSILRPFGYESRMRTAWSYPLSHYDITNVVEKEYQAYGIVSHVRLIFTNATEMNCQYCKINTFAHNCSSNEYFRGWHSGISVFALRNETFRYW